MKFVCQIKSHRWGRFSASKFLVVFPCEYLYMILVMLQADTSTVKYLMISKRLCRMELLNNVRGKTVPLQKGGRSHAVAGI